MKLEIIQFCLYTDFLFIRSELWHQLRKEKIGSLLKYLKKYIFLCEYKCHYNHYQFKTEIESPENSCAHCYSSLRKYNYVCYLNVCISKYFNFSLKRTRAISTKS